MKTKVLFLSLLISLAGFSLVYAVAQDEDVRGAFLTSRPKASPRSNKAGPGTKPSRRRPKPSTPKPGGTTGAKEGESGKTTSSPTKPIAQRLGLGLTLFMRDANGMSVRIDPSHEFRKGDHVRALLETNADGYLYIFNSTDGGQPVMIYPDPELDEAGNYLQGHVPFEIPSSGAVEERLRWFTFDQNAGVEKVYFVFTREPLPSVPIEDDLISYCREKGKCPLQPGLEVWTQVQKEANAPIKVAKAVGAGKAQTASEQEGATRGIGLNRDDPEPSLIMLTTSTTSNMLVATLELIHK